MITIMPKPVLAIHLLAKRPLMTLSIPTISKRTPIITMIDTIAVPGKTSISIERVIATAPSPI
jgi:hypothetical protein